MLQISSRLIRSIESSFYELFYIYFSFLLLWHFYFVFGGSKERGIESSVDRRKLWDAGNNINRFKDDNEILLDKQITVPISLYNTCINNKRSKFDKVYEQDPQFFILFLSLSLSLNHNDTSLQKLNNFAADKIFSLSYYNIFE